MPGSRENALFKRECLVQERMPCSRANALVSQFESDSALCLKQACIFYIRMLPSAMLSIEGRGKGGNESIEEFYDLRITKYLNPFYHSN